MNRLIKIAIAEVVLNGLVTLYFAETPSSNYTIYREIIHWMLWIAGIDLAILLTVIYNQNGNN